MSTITAATILVAEEEEMTRSFLSENLSADGYRVLVAPDRAKALALLSTAEPDLVARRRQRGHAFADRRGALRRGDRRTRGSRHAGDRAGPRRRPPAAHPAARPRLATTSSRSRSPIRSCAPGSARCCAARSTRRSGRVLRAGPLRIDTAARDVRVGERRLKLSAKEYELLVALASEPHRVFTREELLRIVWGFRTLGGTRTLDSHASRLRRKLCDGRRGEAGGQRVGRRLPAVRPAGRRDERRRRTGSVDGLYEQLACERAGQARAALAQEANVERLFAASAQALEDAAGVLLHAATAFIAIDGPLPEMFAEQAGALLAVAARFEEAADLSPLSRSQRRRGRREP